MARLYELTDEYVSLIASYEDAETEKEREDILQKSSIAAMTLQQRPRTTRNSSKTKKQMQRRLLRKLHACRRKSVLQKTQ